MKAVKGKKLEDLMHQEYLKRLRMEEYASGVNDVPEMEDAVRVRQRPTRSSLREDNISYKGQSIRRATPRPPPGVYQNKQAMNKAARSIDGMQNDEIVWSDSKEATKEMKQFQTAFRDYLGIKSVFGFVKNSTSRDRPFEAFGWPSNSAAGVRTSGTRADFQSAFDSIERGRSPYRLAFEVTKSANKPASRSPNAYKLRTFGESRDSFRWEDIDPWSGNGIASRDLRPLNTKNSMPREKLAKDGIVKLAPPIHFNPQIEIDEDDFRFKYEAKGGAKAKSNDITLFSETKPPFIIQGSPPKFGNFTWGFNEDMESIIEAWAKNDSYFATPSGNAAMPSQQGLFVKRGIQSSVPFEIDVEFGEAVDIANPDTIFPVGRGRNIISSTGQNPEFITTSRRSKTPDGYKIPGFLFEPYSDTWTRKQANMIGWDKERGFTGVGIDRPLTDDRTSLGDPIQGTGKGGDLKFSKKMPQFKRTYKNADGKSVTFASRKAGDGLVIWNNKSSARKIADIGRSRGWLMRTVPVAGGWVNLAAPRTHYQPFDSRYNDENRQILETFGVAQSRSGGYRFGTVPDGFVDELSKTKSPRSLNSSKSLSRDYFRRRL